MKKLLLILLIMMSLNVFAQIKVKEGSFKKIEGYVMLDKHDHTDVNESPMALIKISTENITAEQRTKFKFEGGNMITYVEGPYQQHGEMFIYISAQAATSLVITHSDYGKTEFNFTEDLCNFCGYEVVVQYIPIAPQTQEPVKPQNTYLIINADQDNAMIYIDGEYVGDKEVSRSLSIGSTHTWKVECSMYHTESGTVTLDEKTVVPVTLRPNYGYININTSPEQGAKVFVDGEFVGVSPVKTDKLKSGTYSVKVAKEMYMTTEHTVTVSDGQTTDANLKMSGNFVNVTINTDADSDIYVDEQYKGKGKWTGRLNAGTHYVEAKKTSHETTAKNVDLVLGKTETITLESPKPIYGFLDVNSTPMMVEIYVDGKHYGQTPNVISDLLIGTHELKLEKSGCASITKTITIKEGETLSINEKLQSGVKWALVEEAYERMQYDVNAAHILVKCEANALPSDTLKAYEKAMSIRERAMKGEDFGDLAEEMSDDPSARDAVFDGRAYKGNRGELGYFSVFDMVYPFETGTYNTEVGKVSMPVRSSFGYHIIKVNSKTPAMGVIKAAHVFVASTPETSDSLLKEKVNNIYNEILPDGSNWVEIVKKYSEDKRTVAANGMLSPFRVNNLVPEFITALKGLKINEISKPVKTSCGYHIIKLISTTPPADFETEKQKLAERVERDMRGQLSEEIAK